MMYELTNPDEAPQPSQLEFAHNLADSMGYEEAMQVCRDNSWYCIWDILRQEDSLLAH